MMVSELKKGLIVSCQAQPNEPMFGSDVMAKFALAAQEGGAVAVRINTEPDVAAVKKAVQIPIIGLIKQVYPDSWCYITPTLKEVEILYNLGVEIIAVDACKLAKPGGVMPDVFIRSIKERFPDVLLMADVATVEEGVLACECGADLVSSTLSGYTPYTIDENSDVIVELRGPDFDLVEGLVKSVKIPVIAEGRFWDAENAVKALKMGAHAVVIGAGITRPQVITKKIVDTINAEVFR